MFGNLIDKLLLRWAQKGADALEDIFGIPRFTVASVCFFFGIACWIMADILFFQHVKVSGKDVLAKIITEFCHVLINLCTLFGLVEYRIHYGTGRKVRTSDFRNPLAQHQNARRATVLAIPTIMSYLFFVNWGLSEFLMNGCGFLMMVSTYFTHTEPRPPSESKLRKGINRLRSLFAPNALPSPI